MKKEYGTFNEAKTQQILSQWDLDKIKTQKEIFEKRLADNVFPVKNANGKWYKKDYFVSLVNAMDAEIANRNGNTAKENDVPAPVVEIPIPTMAKETATGTSNTDEKNVKKVLPKNVKKTLTKSKTNTKFETSTNKTKTTEPKGDEHNKKENKTMNKNEINSLVKTVTIAPNAVKKIMVAQKKNKTKTDARYWGGWATVRTGMNAAYNDYEKYQNLETEWLELRSQLGGMKSDKYHFCWGLINKNRVGVKQEPNATLRFIKNVKIRIAMAKDVLANKYSRSEINSYMNGLSMNYKIKYGLV